VNSRFAQETKQHFQTGNVNSIGSTKNSCSMAAGVLVLVAIAPVSISVDARTRCDNPGCASPASRHSEAIMARYHDANSSNVRL
jgi:hypothetical protein